MRIFSALFAVAVFLATETGAVAQSTAATGGGLPVPNIKSSVALHFILCKDGSFPAAYNDGTLHPTDRSKPLIGEIRVVAFPNVPTGWVECFGQALNVNQTVPLFSVLLYNFGGGGVNFFMPNFYGSVPIGAGQGPGLPNQPLAQSVGYETAIWFADALPVHTHTIPSGNTGSAGFAPATIAIMQPSLPINFLIDGGGEIMIYAGPNLPSGFVVCDGSLRQIAVDTGLYNIIGTTYGGDGVTTFALPDLRGRSPVGTGTSVLLTTYHLGQTNGAPTVTLTPANLPVHNHLVSGTSYTGLAGASIPYDERQPTLAMTWLINYNGNAPTSTSGPPFAGELRLIAGPPPASSTGWVPADGLAYGNFSYPALHSAIGTTYGAYGTTGFYVPQLIGRMAANLGGSFSSLGVGFDRENVTLTVSNMPPHVHALPVAPQLTSVQRLGDGTCQFSFTNIPNNSFTLLTSTNATLPMSNWTSLGTVSDSVPGQYQVTFAPTNGPQRFYRMRLP